MGDIDDDDSDEEDDDYNPDLDDTGEAGEGARAKKRGKRKNDKETFTRRGGGAPGPRSGKAVEEPEEEVEPEAAAEPEVERVDPRAEEKKARADELWAKMNAGKAPAAAKASSVLSAIMAGKPVGVPKKKAEPSWMASLNALSARRDPAAASSVKQAAAEALQKATNATALVVNKPTDGVVVVKETRRFAGKDIEIEKTYEAGTKAAKEALKRTAPPSGGIDAVIQAMEKKRKLSVLDKTKMDWDGVKKTDAEVLEDVEQHKKSGATYLEQQNFLKDVELREYERERDARLAADPRNRGRL